MYRLKNRKSLLPWLASFSVVALSSIVRADPPNAFVQTNLVSDSSEFDPTYPTLDPNMEDAWGIATRPAGAGGHIWIDNAFTGTSDEYIGDVNGTPLYQDGLTSVPLQAPAFTDRGTPFVTGLVYNASSDLAGQAEEFPVSGDARNADTGVDEGVVSGSAKFIFVTEDGCINAWLSNTETAMYQAPIVLDYSKTAETDGIDNYSTLGDPANPVYSGVAITDDAVTASQVGTAAGNHIFAADFRNGKINVFNDEWQNVTSSYTFQTPANLVATSGISQGQPFHPFNIADIGGDLYVSYAAFNPNGDEGFEEIDQNGDGAVVEYSETGQLIKEFTDSTDPADELDAPWGMAVAPANWGPFGGDLIVTNFGDNGTLSVFDDHPGDPNYGDYLGKLEDTNGNPISIDGIWGLTFGNGLSDGDSNSLYFTAGPNSEFDGIFGRITVASVPEPSSLGLLAVGGFAALRRRRRKSGGFSAVS
jgi:uncharacterized protein (TIGR03118 family)